MHNSTDELLQLGDLSDALDSSALQRARRTLKSLRPAEVARLLESSPPYQRRLLWRLVDKSIEGEVLQELSDDVQAQFLRRMNTAAVVEITEGLDTDDIADILQQLPERVLREVLSGMSIQDRDRVESVLSYEEDTAGGLMNTDTITVRPRLTLDAVLLFAQARHPARIDRQLNRR